VGDEIDADRRELARCKPFRGPGCDRRDRSVDRNRDVQRVGVGVGLLELDGRDVAERFVQAVVVLCRPRHNVL
jgi:hypothetical protein